MGLDAREKIISQADPRIITSLQKKKSEIGIGGKRRRNVRRNEYALGPQ